MPAGILGQASPPANPDQCTHDLFRNGTMTAPPASNPAWRRIAALVGTLAAGFVGGIVARLVGLPLPWLLGPLFVTAALGLAGAPIVPVGKARTFGQIVVGTSLGLQFTSAILLKLVLLTPLIVGVTVVSTVIGAIGALMLVALTGLDRKTAFFATTSGGVVEMANIAARHKAELEPIAVVHTMRVAFIVVCAPLLVIGFTGGTGAVAPLPYVPWPLFIGLLVVGAAVGFAIHYFELPNAWFLGPLAVAACFATLGLVEGRAPDVLLIAAQVFMGTSLGTQFRKEFLTRLLPLMLRATLVILFTTGTNAAIGVGLAYLLGYPVATMVLAMVPGGMAEMVLTAKLLDLDAMVVMGFQLLRIVMVLLLAELSYRLFIRFTGRGRE
jgi:membrane AbrB-like protein